MKHLGMAWAWARSKKELVKIEVWKTSAGSFVVRDVAADRATGTLRELREGQFARAYKSGQPVTVDEAKTLLRSVGLDARFRSSDMGPASAFVGRCCYAAGLTRDGFLLPAVCAMGEGKRVWLITRTSAGLVERETKAVCPAWWLGKHDAMASWLWTGTACWNERRDT